VELQMQNLDPDVFGIVYAGLLTLLAVFLVRHAQSLKFASRQSFWASCRMLLLVVMPMLLGWAWKDCLRQIFWERLHAEDSTILLLIRLGFATVSTLLVVLLTRCVNSTLNAMQAEDEELEHRQRSQLGAVADSLVQTVSGGALESTDEVKARVWNTLLMVCKSFAVFISWCWHAVARESGVLARDKLGTNYSEIWSRGIYAALVTGFFTWTTIKMVNAFKFEEDEKAVDQGAQAYKKTWKQYFKLVGSTKGYMIGWAWSEFFEMLLIGRSFNRIHVDYTVYTGLVIVMGMLITTHMTYLDGAGHKQGSLLLELNRVMLHVAGMMAGWSLENWLQTAIPSDQGGVQLAKAFILTIVACIVYHLIRRNMPEKVSSSEAGNGEPVDVEMTEPAKA